MLLYIYMYKNILWRAMCLYAFCGCFHMFIIPMCDFSEIAVSIMQKQKKKLNSSEMMVLPSTLPTWCNVKYQTNKNLIWYEPVVLCVNLTFHDLMFATTVFTLLYFVQSYSEYHFYSKCIIIMKLAFCCIWRSKHWHK